MHLGEQIREIEVKPLQIPVPERVHETKPLTVEEPVHVKQDD